MASKRYDLTIEDDILTVKFLTDSIYHFDIFSEIENWKNYSTIVFDLDSVEYLDTDTVSGFIKLQNNGCEVKLINVGQESGDICTVIGLDCIFDIERK